jgi:MTH538 TIR-like domain (DUF1863)
MARRIFISYQHADQMKAKGFNLLQWNKNVNVEFVGRHLLDPVDSNNDAYIRQKIKEQINGSSVTVVLVGNETCNSDWVREEIEYSVAKERPNGVLAIRLTPDAPLPDNSPVAEILKSIGAEIVNWEPHEFAAAVERAAAMAGRAKAIQAASEIGGSCAR